MKNYALFIGIDISKKWFDVALTTDGDKEKMIHHRFDNTAKGFAKMLEWLRRQTKALGLEESWLFCMEHTGVYTLPLCAFLQHEQLDFVIESALRIKRSLGIRRGKDDKADSKDIAAYTCLHVKQLKISALPTANLMRLKNLLAHRARLVKQRTMLKSSSKEFNAFMPQQFSCKLIQNDSKELINSLTVKIKATEKEMNRIIQSDDQLNRLYELVSSVKGIGPVLTIALMVYTNCFRAFSNARKFACYIAIAPFSKQSGSSLNTPARVTKMGYTKIKALLGNGVNSAIMYDKQLSAYFHKKVGEGKKKSCARNAVKNKLIARVFAVVKRGTPFVELNY